MQQRGERVVATARPGVMVMAIASKARPALWTATTMLIMKVKVKVKGSRARPRTWRRSLSEAGQRPQPQMPGPWDVSSTSALRGGPRFGLKHRHRFWRRSSVSITTSGRSQKTFRLKRKRWSNSFLTPTQQQDSAGAPKDSMCSRTTRSSLDWTCPGCTCRAHRNSKLEQWHLKLMPHGLSVRIPLCGRPSPSSTRSLPTSTFLRKCLSQRSRLGPRSSAQELELVPPVPEGHSSCLRAELAPQASSDRARGGVNTPSPSHNTESPHHPRPSRGVIMTEMARVQ